MKLKGIFCVLLTVSSLSWAAGFRSAKVVEMRDASEVGANTVANSSEGVTASPGFIPAVLSRSRVTVSLDNTEYTAIYPVNNHLKITDFAPGDLIQARIEGNKLVIKTLDGKEMKAKIVGREPVESPKPEKTPASQSK